MKLKQFLNFKKTLCFLCAFFLIACLTFVNVACDNGGNGSEETSSAGTLGDDTIDDTTPPDDTEGHNFVLSSQNGDSYTYKCSDCQKSETVTVKYSQGTRNAAKVEGNTITFGNVTEKSTYILSGTFYGNIVVDAGSSEKFELELSGFTQYSITECPINFKSADKATLSAKENTKNYVYDMRESVGNDESALSASIYAACDLNVQGKGALYVKSINNNGIHAKDDLRLQHLELQVECMDNALKGNDGVTIESGVTTLVSAKGKGIKTKNSKLSSKGNQKGDVTVTGGRIRIFSSRDGIDAAHDVVINETVQSVTLEIYTDKYSKYSEESASSSDSASNGNNNGNNGRPGGNGGGWNPGGWGEQGNTDKGDYSTKGMKADNQIIISNGTINVKSYDDSIHANNDATLENGETPLGNVTIENGSIILYSDDDALHGAGKVLISGGKIDIENSYEGIEGDVVEISGGNISIVSKDDGVNGGNTTETAIIVSGGNLYVFAGGDGLDSNSRANHAGMLISGGYSVIISTGQSDSPIDNEKGYKYEGGYVIGIGRNNNLSFESTEADGFSTFGTQNTKLQLNENSYLVVGDFATVKMPASVNQAFVVVLGQTNAQMSVSDSSDEDFDDNGVCWKV